MMHLLLTLYVVRETQEDHGGLALNSESGRAIPAAAFHLKE
jgi:hypothetical protein